MEAIYRSLENVLSRMKKRPYVLDREIPLRVLLSVVMRRAAWLSRGLLKTLLLQGAPRAVFMAPGVNLRNTSMVHFGKSVTLERGVIIDGLSREGIQFGDNVMLGAYT